MINSHSHLRTNFVFYSLRKFLIFLAPFLFLNASVLAEKRLQIKYPWTTDHMHVGVRWQPFGLPKCEEYDANRPLIKEHSSYSQFWVSWAAVEPHPSNKDYVNNMSGYLKAIDHAVNLCVERGVHAELVMWHTQVGLQKAEKRVDGNLRQGSIHSSSPVWRNILRAELVPINSTMK